MVIGIRGIVVLILCVITSLAAQAQWTCPTKINTHLKPFWTDGPLSWATETTLGGGVLDDRILQNGMAFVGLEYYTSKFTFYAEGGAKYWRMWEDDLQLENFRLGMRELYINTQIGKVDFKAGLQSMQFKEQFLLNERAMAVSFKHIKNAIQIEGGIGTVAENFARNGTFCSKCFTYDIVQDRMRSFLGANPLDENFAALVVSVDPSKRKKRESVVTARDDDGFEQFDEFESTDEFSSFDNASKTPFAIKDLLSIDSYGGLAFAEFGQFYPDPKLWLGVYESLQLPFNIHFKGEYLYQHQNNNRGIVLVNSFFGDFSGAASATDWNASYYYFIGIDEFAVPALSYTNLFLGEVLRLDVLEMPLVSAYLKHRFIGKGSSLKLQYAASFGTQKFSELDLQFNTNIGKNFHLIATTGYIDGAELERPFLGRLELRFTY